MSELPKKLVASKGPKSGVFLAAFLGFYFAVVVLSDDGYRLDANCEATGWYTSLVAAIKKERFWRNQLSHIDNKVAELRSTVPNILSGQQKGQQFVADMNVPEMKEKIYREDPQLRPSPAQQYADALRKQADAIVDASTLHKLSAETNKEITGALACRQIVLGHVREDS